MFYLSFQRCYFYTIDPSHKSCNTLDKYPTIHHSVAVCSYVQISATKWCIRRMWDWWIVGFVQQIYWQYNLSHMKSWRLVRRGCFITHLVVSIVQVKNLRTPICSPDTKAHIRTGLGLVPKARVYMDVILMKEYVTVKGHSSRTLQR